MSIGQTSSLVLNGNILMPSLRSPLMSPSLLLACFTTLRALATRSPLSTSLTNPSLVISSAWLRASMTCSLVSTLLRKYWLWLSGRTNPLEDTNTAELDIILGSSSQSLLAPDWVEAGVFLSSSISMETSRSLSELHSPVWSSCHCTSYTTTKCTFKVQSCLLIQDRVSAKRPPKLSRQSCSLISWLMADPDPNLRESEFVQSSIQHSILEVYLSCYRIEPFRDCRWADCSWMVSVCCCSRYLSSDLRLFIGVFLPRQTNYDFSIDSVRQNCNSNIRPIIRPYFKSFQIHGEYHRFSNVTGCTFILIYRKVVYLNILNYLLSKLVELTLSLVMSKVKCIIKIMTPDYFSIIEALTPEGKKRMVNFLSGLLDKVKSPSDPHISKERNQKELELERYFAKITDGFSMGRAKEISKAERLEKLMTHNEFNYGEIEFRTFRKLIASVKPNLQGATFYDLGSGTGKLLVAASMCYPFEKCVGIEILNSLFEESVKLRQKILESKQQLQDLLWEVNGENYDLPQIELHNSDFRTYDWSDGSLVFASSTCYSPLLMRDLYLYSKKLKKGSLFVTLTKKLNDYQNEDTWKVLETFEGETSWGDCTIYVHIKVN